MDFSNASHIYIYIYVYIYIYIYDWAAFRLCVLVWLEIDKEFNYILGNGSNDWNHLNHFISGELNDLSDFNLLNHLIDFGKLIGASWAEPS